jgi:hypothetical protein
VAVTPVGSSLPLRQVGVGVLWAAIERSRSRLVAALAEQRWPLTFIVLLVALIEIPFRIAATQVTAGRYFVGMFWGQNDPAQYYAAMRQGAASPSWLIVDRFTQELHAPALLYPLYVALGKLAWLLGLGIEELFLDASTAGRFALLLAVWSFTRLLSDEPRARRTGLVLIALSGGLTSIVALVIRLTGLPLPLTGRDLNDPEFNTFLILFTAPHLMFGLALMLVAVRLYADGWLAPSAAPSAGRHLALAITVTLLGLAQPFTLLPLCALVSAHGLAMVAWHRRIEWPGIVAVIVTLLAAGPLVVANAVTFSIDPFWGATYGRQNLTLTPPFLDILTALGLLVPLAALGLGAARRPLTPGRLLILIWVPLAFLLMQAPTGVQRRFGIGLHPAVALLAVYGLLPLWLGLRRAHWSGIRLGRPALMALLGQTLFGSSAFTALVAVMVSLAPIVGWQTSEHPNAVDVTYQPAEIVAAGRWLNEHAATDDIVLAMVPTANYLVGVTATRAYVAHWVATLNYYTKDADARWFFGGRFDETRRAFLVEHGIRFVVYGPHERELGADPGDASGLQRVFAANGLDVFEMRSARRQVRDEDQPTPARSLNEVE